MKKLRTVLVAMVAVSLMSVTAFASSNEQTLDEVIGAESSVVQDVGTSETGETGETGDGSTINGDSFKEVFGSGGIDNKSQIDNLKNATKLDGSSEAASKVNATLSKVLSVVIQVISYAVTALLVLRVLLDLAYIVLPFTRSFLSNGYGSNVQSGMGMGAPGMGMGAPGMGMGAPGMGAYGMSRRGMYGMGAPGMGMGMGMGMGAPGMNGMEGSQPGATPSMGRVQLISKTALNAVAAEGVIGPNGKSISPLKTYAKNMVIVLVLAPTFLTLAITGVLTQLGITLGELLAMGISNLGNMF